ncbi:MAG: hypothetical protein ACRYG7_31380 [Janthinobacterium lividum]
MNLRFHPFEVSKSCRIFAVAGGVGLLLLAGCRHESVVPVPVTDYFPVVVGTYRTYAVADSSWTNGVATVRTYQLRERVSEQYADAAGQPAYRLLRSRRADASAAWVDDSVLVVQVLPQAVLLTRNNQRAVELIYPPRAGRGWNANAFSAAPDTITSRNRYYGATVGTSYTTPAAGGQAAKTYDNTVATKSTLDGGSDDVNVYYKRGLQQVYALGVGPVLRRRFYYETFMTLPSTEQKPTATPYNGASHRETLLATGTL